MENKFYFENLVSVIIPTYNSEKYIKKTVFSVLNQTYKELEIVLVDDCSKDNTRFVIEELASQDGRVRFFPQEKNQGAAVARNIGIKNAKGKYIAFLDSDDIWLPEKIEKQMEEIKNGNPFVFCAYDCVDVEGNQVQSKSKIKTEVSYKDELTKTYISTPTVIYDREFFCNPDMPLRRTGQDYAFWLALLSKSNAYGIDEVLVHVTHREGSLSKNKFQNLIDIYEVQTKFEKIGNLKAMCNTLRYLFYAVNNKLKRKTNQ